MSSMWPIGLLVDTYNRRFVLVLVYSLTIKCKHFCLNKAPLNQKLVSDAQFTFPQNQSVLHFCLFVTIILGFLLINKNYNSEC